MTPDCPRLAAEIAAMRRWYRRVTKRMIRDRTRDHARWCSCNPANPDPPRHLARDPEDR